MLQNRGTRNINTQLGEITMKVTVGSQTKSVSIKAVSAGAAANKFPDLLFFAGGISYDPNINAKIRIKSKFSDGTKIKNWKEKVGYIDLGQPAGNMFEGALVKSDDVANSDINLRVEIDAGKGYEDATLVAYEQLGPSAPAPGVPGFYAAFFSFTNAAGNAGAVFGFSLIF